MSHALMIKNMDFSKNALATRTVIAVNPCREVALSTESLTFTHLGSTATLTAALTPSNTTDALVWASSDPSVATVNSVGVVTQRGVGEAVITAICGAASAQCIVSATNVLEFVTRKTYVYSGSSGTYDYVNIKNGDVDYCVLYSNDVVTPYDLNNDGTSLTEGMYPILLGGNATQIEITAPNTVYVNHCELISTEMSNHGKNNPGGRSSRLARCVKAETAYAKSYGPGNRTIIPVEGADSAVFCIYHSSGAVTDEEIAAVSIVVK